MVFTSHLQSAIVAYFLYITSFVAGIRESVVNPKEGADLHILLRLYQDLEAVGMNANSLARSQIAYTLIIKVG